MARGSKFFTRHRNAAVYTAAITEGNEVKEAMIVLWNQDGNPTWGCWLAEVFVGGASRSCIHASSRSAVLGRAFAYVLNLHAEAAR